MHSNNAICLLKNISVIIGIHLKICILHFLQYTLLNFQPLFSVWCCLSKGYFLCTYILPAHLSDYFFWCHFRSGLGACSYRPVKLIWKYSAVFDRLEFISLFPTSLAHKKIGRNEKQVGIPTKARAGFSLEGWFLRGRPLQGFGEQFQTRFDRSEHD